MRSTTPANDPFLPHKGLVGGHIVQSPVGQWSPIRIALVACGLYSVNLILFSFVIPHDSIVDVRWAVVIASLACAAFSGYPEPSPFQRRLYDWTPLMCFLVATLMGLYAGQMIFEYTMKPYYTLTMNRTYTSVSPSASSGAHADAGIVHFTPGTRVDRTKAIRYIDIPSKIPMCAAPIIDDSTTEMSFWAVGVYCCDNTGEFWCGDVLDPTVLSATKWSPPVSTHHASLDFSKACAKAAAVHGFTLGDSQLFLEWSKDPEAFKSSMLHNGLSIYFIFQLLAVFSFIVSFKVKPPKRGNMPDPAKTGAPRNPFGRRSAPNISSSATLI